MTTYKRHNFRNKKSLSDAHKWYFCLCNIYRVDLWLHECNYFKDILSHFSRSSVVSAWHSWSHRCWEEFDDTGVVPIDRSRQWTDHHRRDRHITDRTVPAQIKADNSATGELVTCYLHITAVTFEGLFERPYIKFFVHILNIGLSTVCVMAWDFVQVQPIISNKSHTSYFTWPVLMCRILSSSLDRWEWISIRSNVIQMRRYGRRWNIRTSEILSKAFQRDWATNVVREDRTWG